MNLYISGSNRKNNSYNYLKNIKNDDDLLISLSDLNIQYCIGCSQCIKNETNTCILKDDMYKLYNAIEESDKIIIMTPIYMNQITGILKNVIDRFNPYCASEKLRNKKLFLITVGQMSEEEQEEVVSIINEYFLSLSEFLYFDFKYLYNFTSGDTLEIDNITKMYDKDKLENITNNIKQQINN